MHLPQCRNHLYGTCAIYNLHSGAFRLPEHKDNPQHQLLNRKYEFFQNSGSFVFSFRQQNNCSQPPEHQHLQRVRASNPKFSAETGVAWHLPKHLRPVTSKAQAHRFFLLTCVPNLKAEHLKCG